MERENEYQENNQWQPNEQTCTLAATTRQFRAKLEQVWELFSRQCPEDGTSGKYIGTIGSYQIVVPLFECQQGHQFSWRSDTDGSKLYTGSAARLKTEESNQEEKKNLRGGEKNDRTK